MEYEMILQAERLSRRIEGRTLLDDVTLQIHHTNRIGLIGPTGSGKSLLLRSLAMLEPFDTGELLWRSKVIASEQATLFRSQVMYLHQRAAKFEGSVESILRVPYQLRIHRQARFDRDWIVQQLASVGRDASFLDQAHEQLSGGETQIVALLRAIQLAPQLLLLDEPTSALDAQSAEHVEAIVMRWFDESPQTRGFVWVSHDHNQARRVCDRMVRMNSGKITDEEGALR